MIEKGASPFTVAEEYQALKLLELKNRGIACPRCGSRNFRTRIKKEERVCFRCGYVWSIPNE